MLGLPPYNTLDRMIGIVYISRDAGILVIRFYVIGEKIMNKVITIKPLLLEIGSAWNSKMIHIPKGEVFELDCELEDRIIVRYDCNHRIALFASEYQLLDSNQL